MATFNNLPNQNISVDDDLSQCGINVSPELFPDYSELKLPNLLRERENLAIIVGADGSLGRAFLNELLANHSDYLILGVDVKFSNEILNSQKEVIPRQIQLEKGFPQLPRSKDYLRFKGNLCKDEICDSFIRLTNNLPKARLLVFATLPNKIEIFSKTLASESDIDLARQSLYEVCQKTTEALLPQMQEDLKDKIIIYVSSTNLSTDDLKECGPYEDYKREAEKFFSELANDLCKLSSVYTLIPRIGSILNATNWDRFFAQVDEQLKRLQDSTITGQVFTAEQYAKSLIKIALDPEIMPLFCGTPFTFDAGFAIKRNLRNSKSK
jgi:hypothetical protein